MSPISKRTRAARRLGWIPGCAMLAGLAVAVPSWVTHTLPHLPAQSAASVVTPTRSPQLPDYRDAIPVLTYHGLGSGNGRYEVTPAAFAEQMATLHAAGFHTVDTRTFTDFLAGKSPALPSRPIMITFDDGLSSTYTVADPVLKRNGFSAVAFLITGGIRDGYRASATLNSAEVAAMTKSGRWEFGGHTNALHVRVPVAGGQKVPALTNPILTAVGATETLDQWQSRVNVDLAMNRRRLNALSASSTPLFAYPYSGAQDLDGRPELAKRLAATLNQNGFDHAFLSENADAAPPTQILAVVPGLKGTLLPRLGVVRSMTSADLLSSIARSLPDPLPSTVTAFTWTADGGTCASRGGVVVASTRQYVSCLPQTNGILWRDYRISGTLKHTNGCTASVSVRSRADVLRRARLDVAFGTSTLQIRRIENGKKIVLSKVRRTVGPDSKIVIAVSGDILRVVVDGKTVAMAPTGDVTSGTPALAASCKSGGTVEWRGDLTQLP